MTAEEITPARANALHTKLAKLRKADKAKQADQHDVDEFNHALREAKEAYSNREEVQTVAEVSVGINNEALMLRAKKLFDIIFALGVDTALDAV